MHISLLRFPLCNLFKWLIQAATLSDPRDVNSYIFRLCNNKESFVHRFDVEAGTLLPFRKKSNALQDGSGCCKIRSHIPSDCIY
jgi:hypothetical protein